MPLYQVNAGDRILAADINQMYALLKGVAASGENVTFIYNNGALTFQPSADPAAGTRVVTIKNNAGTTLASWRYDGLIELLAAAADPASAVAGSVYLDTLTKSLKFYDGTAWQYGAAGVTAPPVLTDQVGRAAWDWDGRVAVEATVTGTGVVTTGAATLAYTQLNTGGTSASTAGMRATLQIAVPSLGVNKCRLLKFGMAFGTIDANTVSNLYLTDESVTVAPSATARHIGLRQAGATINFSTADNTTEQVTDISAAFTASTFAMVDITFDGTTAKCYVDNVLKATHTTNVPGASSAIPIFRAYVVNSAAAGKVLYVAKARAVFAP